VVIIMSRGSGDSEVIATSKFAATAVAASDIIKTIADLQAAKRSNKSVEAFFNEEGETVHVRDANDFAAGLRALKDAGVTLTSGAGTGTAAAAAAAPASATKKNAAKFMAEKAAWELLEIIVNSSEKARSIDQSVIGAFPWEPSWARGSVVCISKQTGELTFSYTRMRAPLLLLYLTKRYHSLVTSPEDIAIVNNLRKYR
jgi:hypothetical protein